MPGSPRRSSGSPPVKRISVIPSRSTPIRARRTTSSSVSSVGRGQPVQALRRHAVGAAQVAPVGQGHPQIGRDPSVRISEQSPVTSSARSGAHAAPATSPNHRPPTPPRPTSANRAAAVRFLSLCASGAGAEARSLGHHGSRLAGCHAGAMWCWTVIRSRRMGSWSRDTAIWRDQLTPQERAELGRGVGVIPLTRPDILVVGGGSSGWPPRSPATRLDLGSVLLIEAGRLGSGATGGAAGLLTPEPHEWSDPEPFVELARASLDRWSQLDETVPGGVGLVELDWIGLAPDPGGFAPTSSPRWNGSSRATSPAWSRAWRGRWRARSSATRPGSTRCGRWPGWPRACPRWPPASRPSRSPSRRQAGIGHHHLR